MCALRLARTAFVLLLGLASGVASRAQTESDPCLYSFAIGAAGQQVEPCEWKDSLAVAKDPKVREVLQLFGIPPDHVSFRGCRGVPFSASTLSSGRSTPTKYVVNYPTGAGARFLAPIVHELAHVFQMLRAGGLESLRDRQSSLQIELGADFLSGIAFSSALRSIDRGEFELNLELIGQYRERFIDAHGTPQQRASAFRLGAIRAWPYSELDVSQAELHFVENDYARITRK